jgi:hypothetical protein
VKHSGPSLVVIIDDPDAPMPEKPPAQASEWWEKVISTRIFPRRSPLDPYPFGIVFEVPR